MTTINIGHSPKTVKINDALFLHFFYANNKGRGGNNCTIVKSSNPNRMATSLQQYSDNAGIKMVKTSSWSGNVNFSKRVQQELGLI